MAKSIMFQGTASGVGKSIITAAFCRIFSNDRHIVSPFKSQNMALNSFITKDGKEMGRAQVVQAEAAKVEPDVRMNPVLLKPTTDKKSQVIVMGKVKDNLDASTYHKEKSSLRNTVIDAYESLSSENDIIVIEGAGSPAEINLRENDFVNMGMAEIAQSPVVLIGDIDRGGVFASLYGTYMLLTEQEKKFVKGVVINKFRGDLEILKPGLKMLEELIGLPVLGVIPYCDINIEDEDSLTDRFNLKAQSDKSVNIKVIKLPRISNFTDFDVFNTFEDLSLKYVGLNESIGDADLIIIPGTKNTIEDLIALRESGLEEQIIRKHKSGVPVFGICGGYQMLGKKIMDPEGIECGIKEIAGMSILDIETVFEEEKETTRVKGNINFDIKSGVFKGLNDVKVEGYEIHCGKSKNESGAISINEKLGQEVNYCEGSINEQGNVIGTYLHGIFDSREFTNIILNNIKELKGIDKKEDADISYKEFKEKEYDKLAEHVKKHVDIEKIYKILEKGV